MVLPEPEGFMGPPDHLIVLEMKVFELAAFTFHPTPELPLLFRVGGYYLWWNGDWKRDGSIPIDRHQVRQYLWMAGGSFEFLPD